MAIIKCVECGESVSDKASTCPHCGAPVELSLKKIEEDKSELEEVCAKTMPEGLQDQEKEKTKRSKKPIVIGAIIAAVAIIAVVLGIHLTADKEAPVITGIEKGQIVDVDCGTSFNLNKYVDENIKISDNKSGDIKSYTIETDKEIYDKKTGDVNTQLTGEYPVKVTTKDEAENVTSLDFSIKLNPIHITKDNRNPVIYDGEYAKIKLKQIDHGHFDGEDQYRLIFEYTNKSKNHLEVYLRSSYTYIEDTNVTAYYTLTGGIKPGKKGESECEVYDKDIPKGKEDFKQIESAVGMGVPDEDKCLFTIPVIIDRAAFN